MTDTSVLGILHSAVLCRKIFNVQFSEQIGRKAIKDETTAPLPCESPFFQLPSADLFLFLRASEPEILTQKGGIVQIFPYMLIQNLFKLAETKLLPLAYSVLACS